MARRCPRVSRRRQPQQLRLSSDVRHQIERRGERALTDDADSSVERRPDGPAAAADPRTPAADLARPGEGHRDVQPEGRRRQDHLDDQPRCRARRVRPPGAAGRPRPAGRAVRRARCAALRARPHRAQPAGRAAGVDRRRAASRPGSAGWTWCPATSTCRRRRSSWSTRSAGSRRWPARCIRCSTATTTC